MDTKILWTPEEKHVAKTIERPGIKLPEVDDITRRDFLKGSAGLLVLGAAGCGGGEESGQSGETRTFEHALGVSEVPVRPERVIALDPYVTLPTAVLLDVPVVGTGFIPAGEPFPPFLGDEETEGVENVGWLEFNLESMAALDPDLIIGVDTFVIEETYEELSRIAPTVSVAFRSPDWKVNVRRSAAAFGEEEEAQREISAYKSRIEEFRAAMGDRLDGLEVSLVNIREASDIRIYTEQDITGAILEEAGLRRPENQSTSDPDETIMELSLELISQVDADVIFYFLGSAGGDYAESSEEFERIQQNPLWQNLRSVQGDRAYQVDSERMVRLRLRPGRQPHPRRPRKAPARREKLTGRDGEIADQLWPVGDTKPEGAEAHEEDHRDTGDASAGGGRRDEAGVPDLSRRAFVASGWVREWRRER